MRLSFLVLLACSTFKSVAQDTCMCSNNLSRYIDLVARNYSGFKDKVTPVTQAQYQTVVDSLQQVASTTTDKAICFGVLDTTAGSSMTSIFS